MRIISFDCGIRSLAAVVIEVIDHKVHIISQKATDIKRGTYIEQYDALSSFVKEQLQLANDQTHILVEQQMKPITLVIQSAIVSVVLALNIPKQFVHLVHPKHKLTIQFQEFTQTEDNKQLKENITTKQLKRRKQNQQYQLNKKMAIFQFEYFCKQQNIKYAKKNISDIADAFLQGVWYSNEFA